MNRWKFSIAATGVVIALAAGALIVTMSPSVAADKEMTMPTTATEREAAAAEYEREALDLEAKATRHTELAAQYRARLSGGGKQASALRSLAKHCKRLASAYQKAAAEAREMAAAHREMGKAD